MWLQFMKQKAIHSNDTDNDPDILYEVSLKAAIIVVCMEVNMLTVGLEFKCHILFFAYTWFYGLGVYNVKHYIFFGC